MRLKPGHVLLPLTTQPLPNIVSDLWIPNTRSWNLNLLNNTFEQQGAAIIAQVQPVHSDQQDILR